MAGDEAKPLTHLSKLKRFTFPKKCEACTNSLWMKKGCVQCQRCGIGFHLRCEGSIAPRCNGAKDKAQVKDNTIKSKEKAAAGKGAASGTAGLTATAASRHRVPSIVVRAASDENLPVLAGGKRKTRFYNTKVIETNVVNEQSSDEEYEKTINQYTVHEVLGRGAFGVVRKVTSADDDGVYAMKEINKKKLQRKNYGMSNTDRNTDTNAPVGSISSDIKREIAIMKRLDHPNVIRLYEVLNDPNSDFMYMVFELADGVAWTLNSRAVTGQGDTDNDGDTDTAQLLSPDTVWSYFRDVLAGVHYLHSCNIIHRDIKPDNLLVINGTVKLSDFGVSEEVVGPEGQTNRSVGSVAFWAPELCVAGAHEMRGKPLDVWAMGITLYTLLVGMVPYTASSTLNLIERIKSDAIDMTKIEDENARDILRRMLNKDHAARPTCEELLKHPYVTRDGSKLLKNSASDEIQINEDDHASAITDIRK